ncbi:MAG TPA: aminotransferase class V-fold PLP-dependent enzyme, partial [Planctomycetia bacterium]|nr:aminotransferase class V-fold PLP-dependent enzyme [Planctomycetia bacterium]
GIVGVPKARAEALRSPAGGWFNLADPFGSARFERAESLPGAASFTVGMPNYPAVYAARAGMEYVRDVGVERIAAQADPLVNRCLEEVAKLPVELITPRQPEFQSGILSFKHPDFERIQKSLRAANLHVMAHAGRLRVSIHGYNRDADVETLIRGLHAALK